MQLAILRQLQGGTCELKTRPLWAENLNGRVDDKGAFRREGDDVLQASTLHVDNLHPALAPSSSQVVTMHMPGAISMHSPETPPQLQFSTKKLASE